MEIALVLVGLVAGVLAVSGVAIRFDLPAPLLLVVVGIAASYVPALPVIDLNPDIVLVGLLPPLLYAAAVQTSLVEFRANSRSILVLSVLLVAFTTVGVALVAHAVLPGLTWPA